MIDIYEIITFDEEERKKHPEKYRTNRLVQHICINGADNIKRFIDEFDLPENLLNEVLSISYLWNLPRREYNENKMWVCLSGYTCDGYEPFNNFVIADNIVTEESQNKAISILKYLRNLSSK